MQGLINGMHNVELLLLEWQMPCSNVSGTKKFLEKQTIILEVNSSKNWSENSDDRSRFALESWEIKNEMIVIVMHSLCRSDT